MEGAGVWVLESDTGSRDDADLFAVEVNVVEVFSLRFADLFCKPI